MKTGAKVSSAVTDTYDEKVKNRKWHRLIESKRKWGDEGGTELKNLSHQNISPIIPPYSRYSDYDYIEESSDHEDWHDLDQHNLDYADLDQHNPNYADPMDHDDPIESGQHDYRYQSQMRDNYDQVVRELDPSLIRANLKSTVQPMKLNQIFSNTQAQTGSLCLVNKAAFGLMELLKYLFMILFLNSNAAVCNTYCEKVRRSRCFHKNTSIIWCKFNCIRE